MFCDDREARKHKSHTLLIGKYGIKWEILCGGKFGNTYTLTTSFAPRTPFLGMYPTNPLTHMHKDKWARYSVLQRLEELKIKTKPNVYQQVRCRGTSNMHFQIMEWAAAKNKVTLFGKSWKREKKNTESSIDGSRQTHTHLNTHRLSLEGKLVVVILACRETILSPCIYPLFLHFDFHTMYMQGLF